MRVTEKKTRKWIWQKVNLRNLMMRRVSWETTTRRSKSWTRRLSTWRAASESREMEARRRVCTSRLKMRESGWASSTS